MINVNCVDSIIHFIPHSLLTLLILPATKGKIFYYEMVILDKSLERAAQRRVSSVILGKGQASGFGLFQNVPAQF